MLPDWNLTISNETSSSFSVQWTNLTALLDIQVQHFLVLLKSNKNNNSNMVHKIVNGREEKAEMTELLASSQYIVEVFGIDKTGQPFKTLEVQARTLTGKNIFHVFSFPTCLVESIRSSNKHAFTGTMYPHIAMDKRNIHLMLSP